MAEAKEEPLMELEGIVKSVGIPTMNRDLFVLIDKDGLLYNTVLRSGGRVENITAIEQLSQSMKQGDRIRVSVRVDYDRTKKFPLYEVKSQYRIIERKENASQNQQP